jgi:uncharacterized protein (DUF433 family)
MAKILRMKVDWKQCAAVEMVPDRLSGAPVVRGTRVRPEDLLVNRDEGVPWLVENFGVPADTVREIFAFYDGQKKRARAPAHNPG